MLFRFLKRWRREGNNSKHVTEYVHKTIYSLEETPKDIVFLSVNELKKDGHRLFTKKMVWREINGILTLAQIRKVFNILLEKKIIKKVTIMHSFDTDENVFYELIKNEQKAD